MNRRDFIAGTSQFVAASALFPGPVRGRQRIAQGETLGMRAEIETAPRRGAENPATALD